MQADTELGNPFIKAIKPYLFIEELDDDVVGDLIDEVRAFEDNTIEIDWKFKDEIALLLQPSCSFFLLLTKRKMQFECALCSYL